MKYKIIEILCVVLAVLFIASGVTSQKGSKKSAEEIYNTMTETGNFTEDLELKDNSGLKKAFGFSADDFDSVIYYSSDDVMNVNELLIIKFSDSSSIQQAIQAIEKRNSESYDIFAAYAPEQGELLKNYVLTTNSNTLFFFVGGNYEAALDAFNAAL